MHRNTVKKYAEANSWPPRSERKQRRSRLDPYIAYLRQRQDEGCENAMQLWREIVSLGYPGTHRQVQRWLQQRRRLPAPNTTKAYIRDVPEVVRSQEIRLPSLRELSWNMVRPPSHLGPRDKIVLDHLLSHAQVASVHSLLQQFCQMINERQPERLTGWIEQMKTSSVTLLANFAKGLQLDFQAVQAAMTYPWSNGQTEGQVNRLKLLKRQMYGRANFDLLRLRAIHAGLSTWFA